MIIVYGKIRAKEGSEDTVARAAGKIMEETRQEDGILEYRFYTDVEDARDFAFVEVWRDQEALTAHAGTQHLAEFRNVVYPLLESRDVQVYDGSRLR